MKLEIENWCEFKFNIHHLTLDINDKTFNEVLIYKR